MGVQGWGLGTAILSKPEYVVDLGSVDEPQGIVVSSLSPDGGQTDDESKFG